MATVLFELDAVPCVVGSTATFTGTARTDTALTARPEPNVLSVNTDRVRLAATAEGVSSAEWGADLTLGSIGYAGTTVYGEVRSLDADSDGYDDLDTDEDMSVTLTGAFSLAYDGIVESAEASGTASIAVTATGAGTANEPSAPAAGVANITVTATGAGVANASAAGTASITVSATGAGRFTFSDDFASLNTALWGTVTAGSGSASVAAGELVLDGIGATTDAAAAYLKTAIPAATRTYLAKTKTTAAGADNTTAHHLAVTDGIPTADTGTNVLAKTLILVRVTEAAAGDYANIFYYNTSGVLQRWNGTGWQTTAVNLANAAYGLDNFVHTKLEVTATQWRVTLYDAAMNQLHQCAWVNWSDTRTPADSKYITFGDLQNNAAAYTLHTDSFVLS